MYDKKREEQKHRDLFWQGIDALFEYWPTGLTSLDWLKMCLANGIEAFSKNEVPRTNPGMWKAVRYVLHFNMDYAYIDPEPLFCPDEKEENGPVLTYDTIPEGRERKAVRKGAEDYLVSAAILAKRVNSDTYAQFRALMVDLEYERIADIEAFYKSLETALGLLWADAEIARRMGLVTRHKCVSG